MSLEDVKKRVEYELDEDAARPARQIAEVVREQIPGDAWYDEYVLEALTHLVRDLRRARNKRIRFSVFRKHVRAIEDGEEDASFFTTTYDVDDEGAQMALGQMLGADCRAAAKLREKTGKIDLAEAAFLRAIAKRDPTKPRSAVYTEEQIRKMYDSFRRAA
jgi:hypothetical protein